MSQEIPLTRGLSAIIDDSDYVMISAYKWCANAAGYALRRDKNGKTVFMHREINGTPEDFETDHINGNRLDNRRSNLRSVTHLENSANRSKHKDNTSNYKGVFYNPANKNWRAAIMIAGKRKYLGSFNTAVEAAQAYDTAALEELGNLARVNMINMTGVTSV